MSRVRKFGSVKSGLDCNCWPDVNSPGLPVVIHSTEEDARSVPKYTGRNGRYKTVVHFQVL